MVKEARKIGEVRDPLEKAEIEAEFKAVKGGFHGWWDHWFMLKENRPLRTVIKGIPVRVDEEEVKKELTGMGFKVNPYDMVVVTSERSEEGKELFEVNKVGQGGE